MSHLFFSFLKEVIGYLVFVKGLEFFLQHVRYSFFDFYQLDGFVAWSFVFPHALAHLRFYFDCGFMLMAVDLGIHDVGIDSIF